MFEQNILEYKYLIFKNDYIILYFSVNIKQNVYCKRRKRWY